MILSIRRIPALLAVLGSIHSTHASAIPNVQSTSAHESRDRASNGADSGPGPIIQIGVPQWSIFVPLEQGKDPQIGASDQVGVQYKDGPLPHIVMQGDGKKHTFSFYVYWYGEAKKDEKELKWDSNIMNWEMHDGKRPTYKDPKKHDYVPTQTIKCDFVATEKLKTDWTYQLQADGDFISTGTTGVTTTCKNVTDAAQLETRDVNAPPEPTVKIGIPGWAFFIPVIPKDTDPAILAVDQVGMSWKKAGFARNVLEVDGKPHSFSFYVYWYKKDDYQWDSNFDNWDLHGDKRPTYNKDHNYQPDQTVHCDLVATDKLKGDFTYQLSHDKDFISTGTTGVTTHCKLVPT